MPNALRLIHRMRNLFFEHFPRGVVNIFVIYMSILRLIRVSIFFQLAIVTCSSMRITTLIKILVKISEQNEIRDFIRNTAKTKSNVNHKYLIEQIIITGVYYIVDYGIINYITVNKLII